jgi:hypothetical protein
MKKYTTGILIAALILAIGFSAIKQIQISNLNKSIKNTGGILINSFYNKTNLEYNISQVQNNPSKDNIDALARELSFIQQYFNAIFTLNESKINIETLQEFKNNRMSYSCVNYIFSLANKKTLERKDKENLNRIGDVYKNFYKNISNDCGLTTGVNNINSLASSYMDFIREIGNVSAQ